MMKNKNVACHFHNIRNEWNIIVFCVHETYKSIFADAKTYFFYSAKENISKHWPNESWLVPILDMRPKMAVCTQLNSWRHFPVVTRRLDGALSHRGATVAVDSASGFVMRLCTALPSNCSDNEQELENEFISTVPDSSFINKVICFSKSLKFVGDIAVNQIQLF